MFFIILFMGITSCQKTPENKLVLNKVENKFVLNKGENQIILSKYYLFNYFLKHIIFILNLILLMKLNLSNLQTILSN